MKPMNVREVKLYAAGSWPELISQLTHVPREVLDSRNHPCPMCGGRDRFNACRKKFRETGQTFCNKCDLTGDGIQFIMKVNGWSFRQTLDSLANLLGMTRSALSTTQN